MFESPICANFSYKCAPKPMGRIDPSRFEGVNWNSTRHLGMDWSEVNL